MTIKGGYIKNSERKKVANATPTNSIAFLETPTDFKEPINFNNKIIQGVIPCIFLSYLLDNNL